MPIRQRRDNARVPVLVYTDEADTATLDQLEQVASLPIVFHHVAAMPDVHPGGGPRNLRRSERVAQRANFGDRETKHGGPMRVERSPKGAAVVRAQ